MTRCIPAFRTIYRNYFVTSALLVAVSAMVSACETRTNGSTTTPSTATAGSTGSTVVAPTPAAAPVVAQIAALPNRDWHQPAPVPSLPAQEFFRGMRQNGNQMVRLTEDELLELGKTLVVRDNDDHYHSRLRLMQIALGKRAQTQSGTPEQQQAADLVNSIMDSMVRRPSTDYYMVVETVLGDLQHDPNATPPAQAEEWLKTCVNLAKARRPPYPNWGIFDVAENMNSFTPVVNSTLGLVYIRTGRNADAKAVLEAALQENPAGLAMKYFLAEVQAAEGLHQQAAENYAAAGYFTEMLPQLSQFLPEAITKARRAYESFNGSADGFDHFMAHQREVSSALLNQGETGSVLDVPVIDFELRDWSNNAHRLSAQPGQVVLLDFWAHWCGPCKRELPIVQKVVESYAGQVSVLTVTLDHRGQPGMVPQVAEQLGLKVPVLNAEGTDVAMQYQVSSFPTLYILSGDKIRYRHRGMLPNFEQILRDQIDHLLNSPELL